MMGPPRSGHGSTVVVYMLSSYLQENILTEIKILHFVIHYVIMQKSPLKGVS